MDPITNAQIIAQELYDAGVRYVFGHPGGEVVELIEALAQAGIEFVLMGHESAAALAAGTLGHATGVPGVCLATLGPGASNLTLGIAEAWLERHPLLAISARTPDNKSWYNHQHLPLNELFAPITKESIALTDHACDEQIRYAIGAALTPPRGPVYLSLPGDVAASPPNPTGSISQTMYFTRPTDLEKLTPIAEALNRAKRPVAVMGIALDQRQDALAVRDFLVATGLPYADTPKTKGLADPDGVGYLGTFLSSSGASILNQVIGESDCILGIGYDPVESTYPWHLGDNYYAITHESAAFGSFWPRNEATGDVSELLRSLQAQYDGIPDWKPADFAAIRAQVAAAITPDVDASEKGLAPLTIAHVLQTHL
ncbi:MAG TPA: thiamine pyrophosphate-binding protein, partial [Anaerolineales bacterium]|nr:thiamine pyrophosphate-binding protein [Anaerolineales bacterium]